MPENFTEIIRFLKTLKIWVFLEKSFFRKKNIFFKITKDGNFAVVLIDISSLKCRFHFNFEVLISYTSNDESGNKYEKNEFVLVEKERENCMKNLSVEKEEVYEYFSTQMKCTSKLIVTCSNFKIVLSLA